MINIRQLIKDFSNHRAIDSLSLKVNNKEIFGLLGPNGAGKTTLLRILTMLSKPSEGTVFYNEIQLKLGSVNIKKIIGVVPQHINLDLELTGWENLELHGRLHRIPSQQRRSRIKELLQFTELESRAHELASVYSGGMKRRLMIARALMHSPEILFLDEPTVGLDPQARRKIWNLIKRMNREGMTVFLTTHYIEEAEMLCSRVGIMNQGKLIALGSPVKLKQAVGELVVEHLNGHETEYHFFSERNEANKFAADLEQDLQIRNSNLEDVFIKLTGDKLEKAKKAK